MVGGKKVMTFGLKLKLTAGSVAAVGLFVLAAATPAMATDFCDDLSNPSCPAGATFQSNITTAMQSNAGDGIPDRVFIGPGTKPTPDSFHPASSGSDPLEVIGSGRDSTILTSNASGNPIVVNLDDLVARKVTMRDLMIRVPATFGDSGGTGYGAALQENGDEFLRVNIVSNNPPNPGSFQGSLGVNVINGGTFKDVKVFGASGGGFGEAFTTNNFFPGDILEIDDSDIRDFQGGITTGTLALPSQVPVSVQRSHFKSAGATVFGVYNSSYVVDNSVIEAGALTAIYVQTAAGTSSQSSLIFRNNTLVAPATGPLDGISIGASSSASGNASAVVTDSIIRGFTNSWSTFAPGPASGEANFEMRYSNTDTPGVAMGAGTVSTALGNISQDPKFLGPGNYRLAIDSPSIDAGNPSPTGLADDIEGTVRPLDGNADGTAVRDQGAYEMPAQTCETVVPTTCPITPPDTTAPKLTKLKVKKAKKKSFKVSYRLSEAATVKFKFTPKPKKKRKALKVTRKSKAGANSFVIRKGKLKPGRYRVTAIATDAAGNRAKKPLALTVKIRKPGK